MRTALDTNVLIDLWNATVQGQQHAVVLNKLRQAGGTLLICGVVHTELQAHPAFSTAQIDSLLSGMDILVDWQMTEAVWRSAGQAHVAVTDRRRESGSGQPVSRRPLADHLIGAHALHRAGTLLTRNAADFSDFPALHIIAS